MSWHKEGPVCSGCETWLEMAHPHMRNWFREMKALFPQMHAATVFRSKKEQDAAVKAKLSRAPWPKSKHNKTGANGKPESHAIDVFQLIDGRADWSKNFYVALWAATQVWLKKSPGVLGMRWGGNFKSQAGDFNHFEIHGVRDKSNAAKPE